MNRVNRRKPRKYVRQQRRGNASVIGLIFLVVLLAIGVIVGAVALRDQVVQEFGDAAVGLDALDQSYSYLIEIDTDNDGILDTVVAQASYQDPGPDLFDPPGAPPADIQITVLPAGSPEAPVADPIGILP